MSVWRTSSRKSLYCAHARTPAAARWDRLPDDVARCSFSDIVGFTALSSRLKPTEVVRVLDGMFARFDLLCAQFKVYKVETIGVDARRCVASDTCQRCHPAVRTYR